MASGKTGSTRRVKRAPATASRKAITKAGSGITTRQKKALEEDFPLLKGDGYVIRRIGNDGEFSYSKVFHPPSASQSMTHSRCRVRWLSASIKSRLIQSLASLQQIEHFAGTRVNLSRAPQLAWMLYNSRCTIASI